MPARSKTFNQENSQENNRTGPLLCRHRRLALRAPTRRGWLQTTEPVWTGSCASPCQPLSSAGQRKGHAESTTFVARFLPPHYRVLAYNECFGRAS